MKNNKRITLLTSLFLSVVTLSSFSFKLDTANSQSLKIRQMSQVEETKHDYSSNVYNASKTLRTYKGIAAGWNNAHYDGTVAGYNQLILSFGDHGVDYLANSHVADPTNQATTDFDIGNKLTINGLPISKIHDAFPNTHVGYDHGFAYFYVMYPVELLKMNKNYLVPTLHIEQGTEFMDSLLPEVTLKFVGESWINIVSEDYKIENPENIEKYSLVTYPHKITSTPHAIMNELPTNGVELAFNLNFGEIVNSPNSVMQLSGLYDSIFTIMPAYGIIQLMDQKNNNAVMQTFQGFNFVSNYDYAFEIDIKCGTTSTFKLAINHCLVIDYTFSTNRSGSYALWSIDLSDEVVMDYYKELEEYTPIINYGGSSSYDFMEGDPVYNFSSLVTAFDLYNDAVNSSNIELVYQDGAVTDGKYNAGTWKLYIKLSVEGYNLSLKEVTINVHKKVSTAKIYFGDADPIEVIVGDKLTPPRNPDSYRKGENDYVFDGWYFEGAKWDFENDVVQGDMHLEARFRAVPISYKITVKYEGIAKNDDTYLLSKGKSLPFVLFEIEGATYEVYLNNVVINSLVVTEDVTIVVKYNIVYTYIEAKEATCTEDGNVPYWYSPVFANFYFADSNGRELIKDPFIPKFDHNIIHLAYKDSTCSELGNVDCYYCTNCKNHYVDESAQTLKEDWSIAKKEHILTHHDEKKATCEENGYVEHYTCANEPGVYYQDIDCSIKLDSIVINAIGHDYRAATYEWLESTNGYDCKASITCSHCNDVISETKAGTKVVVRESTCNKEGQVSYSVKFDNNLFNAQTKITTLAKTPHNYVFVEEVKASKDVEGIKAHYECSSCHSYFVKNGDSYDEVSYSDLFYKYSNKGCGGNIETTSLLLSISALSLLSLTLLRRKKED